jgi:hypothetical protein
MTIKSFRVKLAAITEQLKLMRYTVQRTRSGVSIDSQASIGSGVIFNNNAIIQEQTQRLFLERYKQLYVNHYSNLNKDTRKSYSYR